MTIYIKFETLEQTQVTEQPKLEISFDVLTNDQGIKPIIKSSKGNRYPGRLTDCLECRMGEHCKDLMFCECRIEGHRRYVDG